MDLTAEIFVGRAPVSTSSELAAFIRKTMAYAQEHSEYLPRIAMVGEYLGFGGVSDYAEGSMEQIRLGGFYDGYETVGFENHTRPDFFDFETLGSVSGVNYPLYDSPGFDWPKSDLLGLMNGGVHVFNHLGHANQTYCMKLSVSDFSELTNEHPFFIYSQGCQPGWFDSPGCFAEKLMVNDRGAFAAVLNARYGWGTRNSTDGPSQRFGRQYWDAVLSENLTALAAANQDSKEDNLWDLDGRLHPLVLLRVESFWRSGAILPVLAKMPLAGTGSPVRLGGSRKQHDDGCRILCRQP